MLPSENQRAGILPTTSISSSSSSMLPSQGAAPSVAELSEQGASTANPPSPYASSFLERLSKAGGSKDDKAMNLFLNRHGDAACVVAALEGAEKYFSGRLDIMAAFLAQQVNLSPALGSSWSSFKSAVLGALGEEPRRSDPSISLGYVLHTISKQTPPASSEKVHRKARRKR